MKLAFQALLASQFCLMTISCSKSSGIYSPCPYTSRTIAGEVFFETGGYEGDDGDFIHNYVLLTPMRVECVTVGIKSEASSIGFDGLYLRAGALEGTIVPMSKAITLIFTSSDGNNTSEMVTAYNYTGKYEDLISAIQNILKDEPKDVALVKKQLTSRFKAELTKKQEAQQASDGNP